MTENREGTIVTFYSYKGGTGRTMALANVAWILAANGYRVLAVDWDLEAPGLHRFFHPFLDLSALEATPGLINLITEYQEEARRAAEREPDWHRDYARVRPHATSLNWPFPQGGSLDFLSAGRRNRDYSSTVGRMDWDDFYERFGGGQFFDAMRADMRRHYDYTLIDSRTGLSDIADICTVQMPQVLVVCFTLSDQSIDGASAVARYIEERFQDKRIRVLPVPMRIDDGEKEKADAGRALARESFSGLPAGLNRDELANYWGSVEVPYRPFYAYEEILATFGDAPNISSSMLTACERLTSVLTDGLVNTLPSMDESERLTHVAAYTRRRPVPPSNVVLTYVAEDQMWADWLVSVLTRAGLHVVPVDVRTAHLTGVETEFASGGAYRVLAVVSQAYLSSQRAGNLWESFMSLDPSGSRRQLLPVRVGDVRLNLPISSRGLVDLVRLDEDEAATTLLSALDRGEAAATPAPTATAAGVRYPGTVPKVWNVRPRYAWFTGRAPVLDRLRDQLRGDSRSAQRFPQVLYGLGGVGKTQVAREYAHRFRADYDLVWWVEAEQPERVVSSLAELAEEMDLRAGDVVAEAAKAALQALRRGVPYSRWLLIFDNVEDLDRALGLLPEEIGPISGGVYGHILATCRNKPVSTRLEPLEVEVFTRPESVEHLCRRVNRLPARDADRVAEAVGDLPLAVEVAAAWLAETATPVDSYVEQLKEQSTKVLSLGKPEDYSKQIGATWNISIARLREESRAAVRLLELCSFFSAEPISMRLIGSDSMFQSLLPYDPDLRERYMLGKVIQTLNRFALAKVDPADSSIQVHRLVQAAVRAGLSPDEQEEAKHEVHRILAEARPAEGVDSDNPVNDPKSWPSFDLIWPHLGPSGIAECDEEGVRQLMVDRIRYLLKRGELEGARVLGSQLNETWTRELGENDLQTLNIRFELANALRAQGKYQEARAMDEDTLARQIQVLHEDHPNDDHPSILITTGSLAADLRALGRFDEALERDLRIYHGLRQIFGEHHPRTLIAANNLAIDYRLTGDSERARRLDEETVERRSALLGEDHPFTLTTKGHLARDLRETGEYRSSVQVLREVVAAFERVLNADVPEVLRTAKSLAVSLRKAGYPHEAKRITEETYNRYRERYGTKVPDALACGLNLAADYSAVGDKQAALDLAHQILDGYRETLGEDHPFTLACRNNVTIYQRGLGDAAEAAEAGERVRTALEEALGPRHPFTLCTAINLANSYGDLGRQDLAEFWERSALEGLLQRYEPTHPDVLACRTNLAITLRSAGREEEGRQLRAEILESAAKQLGVEHPITEAARAWRRVNRDLEPQPV
ncbi:tetratricopeptide repeat protein [Streptomyces lunaelactis]|uniref:FxSxx-COOH system tetratricopeptide repeat protein n=1 Tax=Streptomyces lunaelactis TaxID=1535768 RepID=UPI00158517B6|nr:FxSxx-COOH system tetratricopeptide repeat protein [Streptomyces lunaelactis]NUK09533.1 tetratricopeptide repeat protein [Streptomyces lunaelactis]NUK35209.1 tetratricopeptide repeat protein [Streptomyces lunaelactis]NUK42268.1 tetratricopeptide repeat protein [Streptomyces lunaelactis]NUK73410.1 tetratricopeptide repeat protein [Streptomyces lunaelactis]NUK77048.1 tetratricopeptide repeat protein [Streptomyces lunaelactis]